MKVWRYLSFLFLGGVVGFFISLLLTGIDFQHLIQHIDFMSEQFMIISCIIVTLCIVGLTLWQYQTQKVALKLKSRVDYQTEIEETDTLENQANMKFLKVSIIVYVQYFISFVYFFILALGNEGERHITLVSLYKVYHMNLSLIIIGVVLLSFFSLVTGINQFLGILFMIVLFAYNAFGYLWKVSRFYREE